MAMLSKNAFGNKEKIEDAMSSGLIDEYDILYLDDGEIAWVDKSKNIVFNTPRIQSDIESSDGDVIKSGQTIDEAIKTITQAILPKIKESTLEAAKEYANQVASSPVEIIEV
mgnify:CR=1 FL=1|nr:MAG TPA: hypothetical protein [Caudoviricetes sp.]